MSASQFNNTQPKIDIGVGESSKFDVVKLAAKAVSILPWYVLSIIVSLLLAQVYLEFSAPVFRANSLVLIRDHRVGTEEQKILSTLSLQSGDRSIENEKDVLQSYTLMNRVVDSLKLDLQFFIEGRIRRLTLYGKKSPFIIDYFKPGNHEEGNVFFGDAAVQLGKDSFVVTTSAGKSTTIKYGDTVLFEGHHISLRRNPSFQENPNSTPYITILERQSYADGLRNAIELNQTREFGGVLELALKDIVPERAEDILNVLVAKYVQAGVDDKNTQGLNSIKFLNERLAAISGELGGANSKVAQFRSQNNGSTRQKKKKRIEKETEKRKD